MTDRAVKLVLVFTALLGMLIMMVSRAEATTLYVATDGSDSTGNGTKALPYATIGKARDIIAGTTGNTVYIRGGTYYTDAVISFDSGDNGAVGAPNVYRNYPGETPIISGGQTISGTWVLVSDGVWSISTADEFNSLWVDGVRATRAREPDTGFYYIEAEVAGSTTTKFEFAEGNIKDSWTNLASTEVVYVSAWKLPRIRISDVNDTNNVVTVARASNDAYGDGNRYWCENVFTSVGGEGIDTAGEWYLDTAANVLYYYPLAAKNPNTSTIVAGDLGNDVVGYPNGYTGCLVDVLGTTGTYVEYIDFIGLTFSHTDWYLASGTGYAGWQTAFCLEEVSGGGCKPAVSYRYARNCLMKDCTVSHIGGNGLNIFGEIRVTHSTFTDIGANAIRVGTYDQNPAAYLYDGVARQTTIADNRIDDMAVIFEGAGILAMNTDYTALMHNTIHDCPYAGISLGWGSDAPVSQQNVVKDNYVYTTMQLFSDGGAIYIRGAQLGTEVSGNKVYDCDARAMYLDESCSDVTVEQNWIHDSDIAMLIHESSNNTIQNNVFDARTRCLYPSGGSGNVVTKNIFHSATADAYPTYDWGAVVDSDYNLWFQADVASQATWAARLATWKADDGDDTNSLNTDPLFTDYANHDFELQLASPALDPQGGGGIGYVDFADRMARTGVRSKIVRIQ